MTTRPRLGWPRRRLVAGGTTSRWRATPPEIEADARLPGDAARDLDVAREHRCEAGRLRGGVGSFVPVKARFRRR